MIMCGKKLISICIPCYNEEMNLQKLYDCLMEEWEKSLGKYDYEILFIDNKSKDRTREVIRCLCGKDKNCKAIFNKQNFGTLNSPYYGMCHTNGDATILLCADFQDPIEMIPKLVREWEKGNDVVCGIKTSSRENRIVYILRSIYYKLLKHMSKTDIIEHFTGFGIYDRKFIDILKELNDSTPFLRGIVAEYAPDRVEIPYEQAKRRAGKSSNNWYSLYDAAMLSFTSYTGGGLRLFTIFGFLCAFIGFIIGIVYLILKLLYFDTFYAGVAPVLCGVFFFGGVQLFTLGMIGEYIMSINKRVINRPLVIEEERINF